MVRFLGRYGRSESEEAVLSPVHTKSVAITPASAADTVPPHAEKHRRSAGASGLLRKMAGTSKKKKLPSNDAPGELSMSSGSKRTTNATELLHPALLEDDRAGAAKKPVFANNLSSRRGGSHNKRDGAPMDSDVDTTEVQRGVARTSARSKIKSALLERNRKADDANIAVVYNSYGEQASKVCKLVLKEDLPVNKDPLNVIIQVEVRTLLVATLVLMGPKIFLYKKANLYQLCTYAC